MLSWSVFKDLFLTQISMLTAWEVKSAVNGAHELLTPETLCCQVMHRSKEKMVDGSGWKVSRWAAEELVWPRRLRWSRWLRSLPMATMAPVVLVALMAPKSTVKILKTCLRLTATPTDADGSRSLRRVDNIAEKRVEGWSYKIAGKRVEGLSYKIDGERAEGLSCKIAGKSDTGTPSKKW